MSQLRIKELLGIANAILDKGFHFLPGFVMVKSSEMEAVLDRIDASIPEDIKEAESILRRREEIQNEAQREVERILNNAQAEANKRVSESEIMLRVHMEAEKIKEQVLSECQELRDRTVDEARQIKIQAEDEAHRIKEGAENYAEQILNNIEGDLSQLHQIVKNGQLYLEKLKTNSGSSASYAQDAMSYQTQEDYTSANYPM